MTGDSRHERCETDTAEPCAPETRIQCLREGEQEVEDEAEVTDLMDTIKRYGQHGPAAFTKHASLKKELFGGD